MAQKSKLELNWIGKYESTSSIEPRIFIENPELSYGNTDKGVMPNGKPWQGNLLIHGDNLLALKALESDFSGCIKCVYIDPPYNIQAAVGDYYDDNLENSLWLNLMYERVKILWRLLTNDGLLAVQIDDTQFARLYIMMSEVCGEKNMKIICVKMSEATGVKMASVNKAGSIAKVKEFIILAKKDGIKNLNLERVPKEKWDSEYKTYVDGISDEDLARIKTILQDESRTEEDVEFVDNALSNVSFFNMNEIAKKELGTDANEEWCYAHANRIVQFATLTGGAREIAIHKKQSYQTVPSAFSIVTSQKKMYLIRGSFNTETSLSRCKMLFSDQYLSINPGDLWLDIKTTGLDNEGCVDFKNSKKPERLIKRIIMLNTKENDIVLDSFLGSGTTAAVALKMKRRFIGIELGEHAYTHCVVRLKEVIDGNDSGGISKVVNWKGGGGYRFYELAPSLLKEDLHGNLIINKEYNADMLAAAMAKQQGFFYQPSLDVYWKQGYSSENDYIYTTTQFVTAEHLSSIADSMQDDESLLICCKSFQPECKSVSPKISLKKIPAVLLNKCEFNHDDYSLNVVEIPSVSEDESIETIDETIDENENISDTLF